MMYDDNDMDRFIKNVAGNVARSFPPYVTKSDVAHHIWVWYLENEVTVTSLMRDNESWEPMLYGTMTRVANEYALEEEAQANGYSRDDVYFYTTKVVRELLKDTFDYENWQSFSSFGDGQPKQKAQANTTGDRIAMLADVKAAVEKLGDDQYNIILWIYKFGVDYPTLAETLEVTEDAARKRVSRAVQAVRKLLGQESLADLRNAVGDASRLYATEGEHRRFGNAQARAVTESQYSG